MPPGLGNATRVLIVDDEPKFCQLLTDFFVGRGYEVSSAANGFEALDQVSRFKPDVVLLDLCMPGLSGLDVANLLRSRAFPPRLIVVSAVDGRSEMASHAFREGIEAYVCKPVHLGTLERLISRMWPSESALTS